jgi:HSP20 family protein
MAITRWDPIRDLMTLQSSIQSMLNDAPGSQRSDDSYGTWAPPVDIFERGDDLIIRAELPGVERKDMDIQVENNTLTLRGERKRDPEIENGTAYRVERVAGGFMRRFSLPTTVDSTKIVARHKDGILEIVLPKMEVAKARRVEIRVE